MEEKKQNKITYGVIIVILITLLFVFTLQIRSKAKLESEDEIIATLEKENEDNPESIIYLVTDKFISNVMPETSVETFKSNLEEIKVYKILALKTR